MKIQNTLENKTKFFAQYWGQDVLCRVIFGKNKNEIIMHNTPCSNLKLGEIIDSYLELKPLSQISDEESILMYRGLETHYENAKQFLEDYAALDFLSQNEADILRSKGYALPWMDLSVEDLVEYGWVKLKEN